MADKITLLQEQLGKIIKGKKQITDKMLMAVLAKGHILLEDGRFSRYMYPMQCWIMLLLLQRLPGQMR